MNILKLGSSALGRLCRVLAGALLVVAALASDIGAPRAQDAETAEEVFRNHISEPIIQTRCVNCHVQGGLSSHTRLVFVRRSVEVDYEALNLQTFENFLAQVDDESGGGARILNKIQGVSHGGGVQVPLGSTDFANMERFLGLLGETVASGALTPETLFDTVALASPRKTLRRAALIFAGRIPTEEEYATVEHGDESVLRATIRGLMEGPQFHEFLLRASNDRLLTDRDTGGVIDDNRFFTDFVRENYRRRKAAYDSGDERAWDEYYRWRDLVQYGARRAPLELIAYVAENDRPYTEILTAGYIMANPWAAAAYGASTQFDDPTDPHEFKPSGIVSYYRRSEGYHDEYDLAIGATLLIDPGPLYTEYPHAGILNTTVFLQRYPTTATNRNRARSRWTYYHFLGIDVEKSASRTTDPNALADIHNPTMHNSACTVCHSVLDPVAGAFQNYDDEGMYKSQWGGLDSLDGFYKEKEGASLTIEAQAWAERDTLIWPVSLTAGVNTLRVIFRKDFEDDDSDVDAIGYLDRLDVIDVDGQVSVSQEFEAVNQWLRDRWDHCWAQTRDHIVVWTRHRGCAIYVEFEVPDDGVYDVDIVAWAERYERDGEDGLTQLEVVANPYHYGDTWYRNMRIPGFADEWAPHSGSTLQWLAQQIIAGNRFAEATVKFWWPAIMGSEIAEFPEEAADTDFEGRLLAASAQDAEVIRLADGFRDGFQGSPYTYNLKDLLVEIVLSRWFRAAVATDVDPVRRVALHDAGARRLLTPEELARKTASITGVQWGRRVSRGPRDGRWPSALTDDYRLLYGGIDSDGITERARDVTSVMAGVAKRHGTEVSCSVVLREIYLLPDAQRRLFAGTDRHVTPGSEASAGFEIEADSQAKRETLSLSGPLTAGSKAVRVTFTNDYWDEVRGDRNVRLDRLEVRNAAGRVVTRHELERLAPVTDCNYPVDNHFALHCRGSLDIPIEITTAGNYAIEVVAWADQAGDELPKLSIVVESTATGSGGDSDPIRNKLVELHDKLFGVQVTPDSPDVEAAYRLFVDVMARGREAQDTWFEWWRCRRDDHFLLEGILDDVIVQHENEHGHWWYGFDGDRVDAFMDGIDFSDPHYTAQAWVVVLAAMMMDYRYLYLQ